MDFISLPENTAEQNFWVSSALIPATGLIIFFRVVFVFIYVFFFYLFFFSPLGVLFSGIYSVKHVLHGRAGA